MQYSVSTTLKIPACMSALLDLKSTFLILLKFFIDNVITPLYVDEDVSFDGGSTPPVSPFYFNWVPETKILIVLTYLLQMIHHHKSSEQCFLAHSTSSLK